MPTECTPDFFGFEPVEGREVVAAFDAGAITSDAGALLLGATDRAIKMMDRFASCFHDVRRAELIEHEVATLVGQRVFGIALGYEDLNDHDELRHDPMMAVLAGKLEARREDCAPVAGKSTLNRLELSRLEPTRYHRISHNSVAIKGLLVDLFLEAARQHRRRGRFGAGGGAHRRADPQPVAAGAHSVARRQRLRTGGTHGLADDKPLRLDLSPGGHRPDSWSSKFTILSPRARSSLRCTCLPCALCTSWLLRFRT